MTLGILTRAIVSTARISLPTVVEAQRGAVTQEECDARLAAWSRELLDDARVTLEVRGREHIEPDKSYVVMSNHSSLYDIPVLFQALPLRLRMAAKAELFRIPVWGRAMRAAEFVRIDRSRGADARAALVEAGLRMKEAGVSLWIAPEGTRSPDERLLPFKTGGFTLARTAELPILPITLRGTREILGKHGWRVERGRHVEVSIHPPLAPEEFPLELPALVERVRRVIEDQKTSPASIST